MIQDYKVRDRSVHFNKSTKFIYFITLLLLTKFTLATNFTCAADSGGVLDSLVTQFGEVAETWQNQINPLAKKIFFILFSMEFLWQLMVKKIFAGDIEKLWVFFFTRCVLCFFFAKYLVNVDLYQGIIVYVSNLGSKLGEFSLNMTPGANFQTLSPSAILGNFSCISDSIHQVTDNTGALQYITIKFTLAIMQVLLFVVLIFIAYYLMKVILQAYFLVYVGFLLTGFAGSSWTVNYWQKYLQAISAVAIKFLVVCLIMGVLNVQIHNWGGLINNAQGIDQLVGVIIKVLGTSILLALMLQQLPDWAAQALAGQVNLHMGNQTSSGSTSKTEPSAKSGFAPRQSFSPQSNLNSLGSLSARNSKNLFGLASKSNSAKTVISSQDKNKPMVNNSISGVVRKKFKPPFLG